MSELKLLLVNKKGQKVILNNFHGTHKSVTENIGKD